MIASVTFDEKPVNAFSLGRPIDCIAGNGRHVHLEETVLEIKRQSILDLQKAVSQTEQKANELLLREREQYQRLKAQSFEEAYALLNRQEDGPEVGSHGRTLSRRRLDIII